MDKENKDEDIFSFASNFKFSELPNYKPTTFLKFDLKLNLVGQFVEAEVLQDFLPIELSKMQELNNRLERGQWLKYGQFYYVKFKPSNF